MGNPINNAFSNYDNKIAPNMSGKGGFAAKFKAGLEGFANGGLDKLKGSIGSFMNKDIMKLNKLKSMFGNLKIPGLDKLGFLKGLFANLEGYLKGFLDTALNMMKDMAKDAIRQLQNAAVSFVSNILEDLYKNIRSMIFIPDIVFCKTIEGLYYAGADLAYFDHYIRDSCLKRDWVHTLTFVDKQYGINYGHTYLDLESDLNICTSNSCWKNTNYIFGFIYKEITSIKSEISTLDSKLLIFVTKEDKNTPEYKALMQAKRKLMIQSSRLERIMVKHFKKLIVNSYSYFTSGNCLSIINNYPDVIKPKYYGTTDDKYNGAFMFSYSDCIKMMPTHGKHKATETDKYMSKRMENEAIDFKNSAKKGINITRYIPDKNEQPLTPENIERINNERDNVLSKNILFPGKVEKIEKQYDTKINQSLARPEIVRNARAKAEAMGNKFRNKTLAKHAANSKSNIKSAHSGGLAGVYKTSRARYHTNRDKKVVKYRKTHNLGNYLKVGMNFFDQAQNIDLRNNQIKHIYIALSSKTIHGDNRMVNRIFYERCKIPTATNLKVSADKMMGIMGTSMMVQGLFGLSDAIDGSAYRYLKQVEDYLFDPKKNVVFIEQGAWDGIGNNFTDTSGTDSVEFEDSDDPIEKEFKKMIKEAKIEGKTLKNGGELKKLKDSRNGNNTKTSDAIELDIKRNIFLQKEIVDTIRFLTYLPMINKRDIILKYLLWFNDLMLKQNVPSENAKIAYRELIVSIFGYTDIDNPKDTMRAFNHSTNESINENFKTLIVIEKTNKMNIYMKLNTDKQKEYRKKICKCYKLAIKLMASEAENMSFAKSTFLYDKDYMRSLLKQQFLNEVKALSAINDPNNKHYNQFYRRKDVLTRVYDGYDRKGIFGYDDNKDRIRFTNIETSDFQSILVSEDDKTKEVFFGGNELTTGNGIKRLNRDKGEIINTNINYGNWDIYEFLNTIFFVNNNNEVFYWNGSHVINTGFTGFKDFKFIQPDNTELILLSSINSKGLYKWNNSRFDKISSNGGNYVFLKSYMGLIAYSTNSNGEAFIVQKNKFYRIDSDNRAFNSFAEYITDKEYTTNEIKPPSSEGGEPETITTTEHIYEYHLILGSDKGLQDFVSESKNRSNFPVFLKKNSDFNTKYPIFSKDLCLIDNRGNINDKNFELITKTGYYTGYFRDRIQGTMGIYVEIIENLYTNDPENTYSPIDLLLIDKDVIYIQRQNKTASWIRFRQDSTFDNVNSRNCNVDRLEVYDGNVFLREKNGHNWYIFEPQGAFLSAILEPEDQKKDEWVLQYLGERPLAFLHNYKHKLGTRMIYRGDSSIGLQSGCWKLAKSGKNMFALSINGTNKGVKIWKNNEFIDINNEPLMKEGDIGGFAYDKYSKQIYFGALRSKCKFDINKYVYDIDRFIYELNDYQVMKLLYKFSEEKNFSIIDSINEILDKDTGETVEEKINNMLGKDEIKKMNTDMNPSADNISGNVDPSDRVTSSGSSITEQINSSTEDLRKAKVNSNIYNEILTHAEAKQEFDIDDNKVLDQLLADFIIQSPKKREMILRLKAEKREIHIKNHFEDDGSIINYVVGQVEWLKKHEYTSNEFLNEYET